MQINRWGNKAWHRKQNSKKVDPQVGAGVSAAESGNLPAYSNSAQRKEHYNFLLVF